MNRIIGLNLVLSGYWLIQCLQDFGDINEKGHKINRWDVIEAWLVLTAISSMFTIGIYLCFKG